MCFDVPKVVRCLGYDHGHDEESRNGRDTKIDILDDYVLATGKVLGKIRTIPDHREIIGTPRGLNGPTWALVEERGGGQEEGRALPSPIRVGRGAGPPFLPPSFLFLPSPTPNRKRGSPTPGGSCTPPLGARRPPWPPPSSTPLYTGEGGTP